MAFLSWLRNPPRSSSVARGRRRTSLGRRASFRPQMEALEERLTQSAMAVVQTNLVSDDIQYAPAAIQDANLVNPWGLAASPTGPWWVANEGTDTSTLYDTTNPQASVVPPAVAVAGDPTSIVYHDPSAGGFNISENGGTPASSEFLFAGVDGSISGWNKNVDPNHAVVAAPSHGALYLGLAIATDPHGATRLYAADFLNGKIDVYDRNFQLVTNLPGKFTDSKLPDSYHPFNIQAIGDQLYVEYAPADEILAGKAGQGEGAVDIYSADGRLHERLIRPHDTHLNQPWAVALAPANFGKFSRDLLVGNFGDGTINAFDPKSGRFVGELQDANGQPIAIPHLWGLAFGNGAAAGPTNTLYFTAGLSSHLAPSDAPFHGLFGALQVAPSSVADAKSVSGPATGLPYPTAATVNQLVSDINYAKSVGGAVTISLAPNTMFDLKSANNSTDGGNGLPVIGGTKAVNLTILGNGDTIHRSSSTNKRYSGFHLFDVAAGSSLTLDHVTLNDSVSNTFASAAIYNRGTLTLSSSTVADILGGGIYNLGGTVTLEASTLSGSAAAYGGGLANYGGTVTIDSSTLSTNSAVEGGGIYNANGTVTISTSNLIGNSARFGGGIFNDGGTVLIANSTLSANYASPDYSFQGGYGGAINNVAGTVTIRSSILSNNHAVVDAAIANDSLGTVLIDDLTVLTGNTEFGSDG